MCQITPILRSPSGAAASTALDRQLLARAAEIADAMVRHGDGVERAFGERAAQFIDTLGRRTLTLEQSLDHRTGEINETFVRHASSVDRAFTERAADFLDMVSLRTQALEQGLDRRTGEVNDAFDRHGSARPSTSAVR